MKVNTEPRITRGFAFQGSTKQRLNVSLELKTLRDYEFEGYGSTFSNIDLGDDIVMPGAFKRTLAEHQQSSTLPQMFWMHDPSRVPGKWLSMAEDNKGLFVHGVLAKTPLGEELRTLLKMEAIRGLSIGYAVTNRDGVDYTEDGCRLLKDVDLWEVSLCSLAMNPLAQVTHAKCQLSAVGEYVPTVREVEQMFRAWGFSKRIARTLVAKMFDTGPSQAALAAAQKFFSDEGEESPGEMPGGSRWDAEAKAAARAAEELLATLSANEVDNRANTIVDQIIAGMIRHK